MFLVPTNEYAFLFVNISFNFREMKSKMESNIALKRSCFTILLLLLVQAGMAQIADKDMVSYVATQKQSVQLFWKNDKGAILGNLGALNQYVIAQKRKLVFAMNAGMYTEDQSPLGLFIQNGKTVKKLNTGVGKGNFYMQPNGVFYMLSNGEAGICKTADFNNKRNIKYATQSGPLLISKGTINAQFKQGSPNLNVRNGIGILPDGSMLFAMSKQPVNFYDFALYFQRKGCKEALYLDGFVSRSYYPAMNWLQKDGNFGVIIGVVE